MKLQINTNVSTNLGSYPNHYVTLFIIPLPLYINHYLHNQIAKQINPLIQNIKPIQNNFEIDEVIPFI